MKIPVSADIDEDLHTELRKARLTNDIYCGAGPSGTVERVGEVE